MKATSRTNINGYLLYGWHTVRHALSNPSRAKKALYVTKEAQAKLPATSLPVQVVERAALDAALPRDAVHQGIVLQCSPLPAAYLDEALEGLEKPLVVLDQVTDPHNIGAILRSAAAFGAAGVVVQDRHAPNETAVLAKAASGALDVIPLYRTTNIARALDALKNQGYWCIGFDSGDHPALGRAPLPRAGFTTKTALVFGAEGAGLRRLVAESCDALHRLPTDPAFPSLNVSNAVAVGLAMLVTA